MKEIAHRVETQQQSTEQPTLNTDTSKIVRVSLIALAFTLGVFLVWAAFAPLDQGAPAGGYVTVANYRKVVQHQYGGTIRDILVKEGDRVRRGQVLVRLEDSEIKGRYAQIRGEYLAALVIHARLNAERAFMSKIVLPEEVRKFSDEPEIRRLIIAQEEFFKAKKAKHDADKRIIMESLKGYESYAKQLSQQRGSYERQLQIIQGQIQSLKGLSEEGYYARNRYLDLERIAEDLRGKISEVTANQMRAEATVQEYMMRLSAIERDYLRDIEAELAEVEKKMSGLRDTYASVKDILAKTEIKSPDDGIVMGLRVHTIGGVITPGQLILEIVPQEAQLIIEAKLSPAFVEDVKKGQSADLHFVALDPKKTPVLEGVVVYASPDILIDETKTPYYLVKIEIKEESLREIKRLEKEIVPGMPVQVVLKSGSRTFLSYLLKPFIDRLAISFLK